MAHPANRGFFISERGLRLIKHFEDFRPHWYFCPSGKPTIGYGHVKRPDDDFDAPISEGYASALLRQDMAHFEEVVKQVDFPLNQSQFDALVSLAYNIGEAHFKSSTLLQRLNEGNASAAAKHFMDWVYATVNGKKKILNGLLSRRYEEKAIFERGCVYADLPKET